MLKIAQKLEMRSSWHRNLPFVIRQRPSTNCLLLCVISVFVLIALSRSHSSGEFDSTTASSRPNIYSNYRKLREQAVNDYLALGDFGANHINDYGLCGKERENGVPCYNSSANLLAGFKDGEEFDCHCELSRNEHHCLIRSPKDYKIPLTWPSGRDVIWSGNVKISKDQFLSSGSKMKRYCMISL